MAFVLELLRSPRLRWLWNAQLLLELFVAANLAVLAGDIVLAHSVNHFRIWAEYIPLYFSADAPLLLLVAILARWRWRSPDAWRDIGFLIGGLSVLVGLAGVVFHLQSSFFAERTLRSLTYAAPFAAPLAYAGLGFLLILNRMVAGAERGPAQSRMGAMGDSAGHRRILRKLYPLPDRPRDKWILPENRVDSGDFQRSGHGLSDSPGDSAGHAPLSGRVPGRAGFAGVVGVLGFGLHLWMNYNTPGGSLFEKSVYGAPPMAPLLFPNLVALALIGLWELASDLPAECEERPGVFDRVLRWAVNPTSKTED